MRPHRDPDEQHAEVHKAGENRQQRQLDQELLKRRLPECPIELAHAFLLIHASHPPGEYRDGWSHE